MWTCPKCGSVGDDVLHGDDELYHCIECDAVCRILDPEELRAKSKWGGTWGTVKKKKKKRGRRKKPPPEEDEDG